MNFVLTKEQQMIKKSASDFAKSKLEPIAYDDDRSGAYPDSAVSEMAKNDFLGMRISSEWN
jgi:alkylation response protein AidB-like acyl-CoA dehydrogenase